MGIFEPLFKDRITSIESITTDGEGTKTRTILYTNVPCFYDDKVTLTYGEVLVHMDCIATFRIPTKYSSVDLEYIITFNSKEYLIRQIQPIKAIIGPIQYYQLRVAKYG